MHHKTEMINVFPFKTLKNKLKYRYWGGLGQFPKKMFKIVKKAPFDEVIQIADYANNAIAFLVILNVQFFGANILQKKDVF